MHTGQLSGAFYELCILWVQTQANRTKDEEAWTGTNNAERQHQGMQHKKKLHKAIT